MATSTHSIASLRQVFEKFGQEADDRRRSYMAPDHGQIDMKHEGDTLKVDSKFGIQKKGESIGDVDSDDNNQNHQKGKFFLMFLLKLWIFDEGFILYLDVIFVNFFNAFLLFI